MGQFGGCRFGTDARNLINTKMKSSTPMASGGQLTQSAARWAVDDAVFDTKDLTTSNTPSTFCRSLHK